MNEDTTRKLGDTPSFEERVLAELIAINARMTSFETRLTAFETRLTSLEDKVDARLYDTRPMWEGVQLHLANIESTLEELNSNVNVLVLDLHSTRVRVSKLEDRARQPAA